MRRYWWWKARPKGSRRPANRTTWNLIRNDL